MIVTDKNGKQWRWVGYGPPKLDGQDYIALEEGFGLPERTYRTGNVDIWRPYAPTPKQHTFGGVVFEEAGPSQQIERGKWYLCSSGIYGPDWPVYAVDKQLGEYTPLRPVRVAAE